MKINTKQVITNLKGEAIKEGDVELTLGMVVAAALIGSSPEDAKRAYILAKDFHNKNSVDITAEDIMYVKEIVTTSQLPTLIKGQTLTLLDI